MTIAAPSLELQKSLVAALRADPSLVGLIGGRVFDSVPPDAPYPYLAFGSEEMRPDRADCYEGADLTVTLDVWSQEPGFPQAKRIIAAVVDVLTGATLRIPGHRLVALDIDGTRLLRDPDGLTSHGVITLTARTELA